MSYLPKKPEPLIDKHRPRFHVQESERGAVYSSLLVAAWVMQAAAYWFTYQIALVCWY